MLWADITRRHDPANGVFVKILSQRLLDLGLPYVLCFWSKAPARIAILYEEMIKELQAKGVLVLAQISLNGYDEVLEPGLTSADRQLGSLIRILETGAVRLRFDPIIPGFTTLAHYQFCLSQALEWGINHITLNFYERRMQNHLRMTQAGIEVLEGNQEERKRFLDSIISVTPPEISLALCAESSPLGAFFPSLQKASCAAPLWAMDLRKELSGLTWEKHPSRKGCGCFYTEDWGLYPRELGVKCSHGCLYCYAG